MSPELVDQTIPTCCKPRFLKVARVISDVLAAALNHPPEEPLGTKEDFIIDRIKALVDAGSLEAAGDLDSPRHSEVRLPEKESSRA